MSTLSLRQPHHVKYFHEAAVYACLCSID